MKKIKIKGREYKFEVVELIDNGNVAGLCRSKVKELYITKDKQIEETCKTITHELIHAYMHECGLPNWSGDEELVEWISNQFIEILRDLTTLLGETYSKYKKRLTEAYKIYDKIIYLREKGDKRK